MTPDYLSIVVCEAGAILGSKAPDMVTTQISLDQYLRTSYRPDCDYVAGELEERNAGEKDHSAVQAFFVKWFAAHEGDLKLEAFPEIRIKVSAQRVRVADVAILRVDEPYEAV